MIPINAQIRSGRWYKQAANVKVYYIFSPCRGAMMSVNSNLGFWFITNKRYMETFLPSDNLADKAKEYIRKQKKNFLFISQILARSENEKRKLSAFYQTLSKLSLQSLPLTKIRELLRRLDKLNYCFWCHSFVPDFYDPTGDELLRQELQREGLDLSDEELCILMKTSDKNYVAEERLNLLEIFQSQKSDPEKAELRLQEHAQRFFYIANSWESTTVLTIDYFRKELQKIANPEQELGQLTTNWEAEHEKIAQRHSFSQTIKNVLSLYRQLSFFRDQRKQYTLLSNHYYDQLFSRLAALTGIPFDDLRVIRVEEIGLPVSRLRRLIQERQHLVGEIYTPEKSVIVNGSKGVGIYNQLQKSYGLTKNIKGRPACKGKVQGIVRVIMGETHFSKFNAGDVLVAPMTRPEYVPLMKKAAAVVTDEGGVTCHAAIISRELGIPCIIGTQKVTSKLKDGMFVEVDAEEGVVRVLNRLKLLTVQHVVNKEIEKYAYLHAPLQESLLNITAFAQKLKPAVSQQVGKDVTVSAIGMAIRRYVSERRKELK